MLIALLLVPLLGCAPDCAELAVEECASTPACAVIKGRQITSGGSESACYTLREPEPVGCQDAEVSCPPAIMYARTADGPCFEIASGCIPPGWEVCPSDDVAAGECPS